jgi:hypothetical protein
LLLEIAYPVLIWIRKLRPMLIMSVVALHVGIDIILGLTEFGLAMIVANIAFISGPWLRSLVTGIHQPYANLHFARRSPRAEALAVLALAADPDRILHPVDQDSGTGVVARPNDATGYEPEQLFLARSDGRVEHGFKAILTLSRWIPLFWPIRLLGMLPGSRSILLALYRSWFASKTRDQSNDRFGTGAGKSRSTSNSSLNTVAVPSGR